MRNSLTLCSCLIVAVFAFASASAQAQNTEIRDTTLTETGYSANANAGSPNRVAGQSDGAAYVVNPTELTATRDNRGNIPNVGTTRGSVQHNYNPGYGN